MLTLAVIQFKTQSISFHALSSASVTRGPTVGGGKAHRPPFRNKVRHGKRPPRGCSPRNAYARVPCTCFYVESVSRAYGGREAKPIDHRLEPEFGMENVPRGMSSVESLRTSTAFLLLYHNCIAGILRAGGKAHRPPTRTEVRHGRRPQRDDIRDMPTHEQCVNRCHLSSYLLAGIRWAGGQRPSTTDSNRSSARTTSHRGMKSAECLHTSTVCLLILQNCLAGIRWAGGRAHRPPSRTGVRHGKRPHRDEFRGMPTRVYRFLASIS